MIGKYLAALAALASLAAATPAMAQYYYSGRTYQALRWQIDAGFSPTVGTTADYLNDGWTVGGGLTWYPSERVPLGLRVDASYSEFGANSNLVALGERVTQTDIDYGVGRVWGGDVDAEYDLQLGRGVKGYLLAGIGGYQREVELYQTVVAGGFFCDPWWGYCGGYYPIGAPVSKTTTAGEFAWNAGLGLEFPLPGGLSWFVDVRYVQIGPPDERTEFVPIRVGLRF
ncbi:MAG: outer membrane beta-barrel protein [Steroidobacteraceae bacterium]